MRMVAGASIYFLFLFCALIKLEAQEKTDTVIDPPSTLVVNKEPKNIVSEGSFMREYANSYLKDTKSVFTNPFHWKTGQIIAAAAITAGTIGLIAWGDKPIQNFFYRNQSVFISKSSAYFFSPLGSGLISVPTLGIFYICGVVNKDKKAKETALKGLEAFVITVVLTNVIKQITHRHRPYQDIPPDPYAWEGPFSWGGEYGFFGYNSFPSGHSSAIFSIATVIALEYWDTKWVPMVSFGLAGITALYRLAVNDHWASDVLFGSTLGFAVGSTVFFNANKKLQIIPVSSSGMGATLIYHL